LSIRARFAGGGLLDVSTAMSSSPSLFVAEGVIVARARASHCVVGYRAREHETSFVLTSPRDSSTILLLFSTL
jgi:hypothetical protein